MNPILALLQLPFLAPLAGVTAILFLVWQLGPLVPIPGFPLTDQRNRLILTVVVIVLFALYVLIKYWLSKRKEKKLKSELGQNDADPVAAQTEEERRVLEKTFEEALSELKTARFDSRRGSYLYQLPWYLIIGPPGSGKTTALLNSRLRFPLLESMGKHSIQGVGGTRYCDWFFTDQAVLIDTAGRYTTQDSQQKVDRAAWQGFLDLLKKHRRQRPINGVIIAISLADLMQFSESELNAHITSIRSRLQELYDKLAVHFPIYVLFTKADLIAGYVEFFDDLGEEARSQVWGITFPLDDLQKSTEPAFKQFKSEFGLLEKRLSERLLDRLEAERDQRRRDAIYTFAYQFNTLRDSIDQFLQRVFLPNRFEQRHLLRGVYFTSGTQEGSPIDRMLGVLATTFGVARQDLPSFSGKGRSYFLQRLFNDVVFQEAGLAGSDVKLERRRYWLQRSAYIGVVALALLAAGVWFASYTYNQRFIAETNLQTVALNEAIAGHNASIASDKSVLSALAVLNNARRLPGAIAAVPAPPWYYRLGLYQGNKISASGKNAYRRTLERALLPKLVAHLETQLAVQEKPDDTLYQLLKIYLGLYGKVGLNEDGTAAPETLAAIENWFGDAWRSDVAIDEHQQTQLSQHLSALLQRWPLAHTKPLDEELVRHVRQRFAQRPSAPQLYQELLSNPAGLSDFDIVKAGGKDVRQIFFRHSGPMAHGVGGLFSRSGQLIFAEESNRRLTLLARSDDILRRESLPADERTELFARLNQLYWDDYCPQWQQMIDDVSIVPPQSLRDAIAKIKLMQAPDSALRRVLTAIREQTADIPQCLESVNELIGGEAPSLLDKILEQLTPLANNLQLLVTATDRGELPDPATKEELLQQLQTLGEGVAAPLGRWLQELADPLTIQLLGGIRKSINTTWRGRPLSVCSKLKSGFPFTEQSPQGAELDQFGQFFGHNGIIDNFLGSNNFRSFVDTAESTWKWRKDIQFYGIAANKLQQLRFAKQIQSAFFPTSGQRPTIRFSITPTELINADRAALELGGKTIVFEPQRPGISRQLQWPFADNDQQLRLLTNPASIEISESGSWAWFRLLERAQIVERSTNQLQVTLPVEDVVLQFELQIRDTNVNPFTLPLEEFRCPQVM